MDQRGQKEKFKKYLETNEIGNTTYQTLWDAAKAVLRGKWGIAINALRKKKNLKDSLTSHFKTELETEQQTKPEVSRRK